MSYYEPVSYWKESGKSYFDKFQYNKDYLIQEDILLNYLSTLKFNSVLEFGCGFGRITRLINLICKPKRYVAVDVSPEQLSHVKDVQIIQSDIEFYPFEEKFDLVIAVEVLMHQLPSKIQAIIDKMISLSKKYVISLDYYSEKPAQLEPHNFNHDYISLYKHKAMRLKIGEGGEQSIFVYKI